MLDTDKIYPATPYKLKNLREKGEIAYSSIAQKALNCIITIGCCYLFLPNISKGCFSLPTHTTVSSLEIAELFKPSLTLIYYLLKVSFGIFFCSLITRIIHTGFLFVPLGRYPIGILNNSQNTTILNTIKIQSVQIIIILTTLAFLYFSYSYFFETQIFSEINKSNTDSLKILTLIILKYLTIMVIFLLFLAILLVVKERYVFLDQQRMTKGEILIEIKETEGSQDTKKQIRSAN